MAIRAWLRRNAMRTGHTGHVQGPRASLAPLAAVRPHGLADRPPGRAVFGRAGAQLPLTCGIDEIVDCAWLSAELTDDVPVIAAWIAVQSACETFG